MRNFACFRLLPCRYINKSAYILWNNCVFLICQKSQKVHNFLINKASKGKSQQQRLENIMYFRIFFLDIYWIQICILGFKKPWIWRIYIHFGVLNTDSNSCTLQGGLTVVDVYSEWSGPCTAMGAALKKIKLEVI